MMGWEGEWSTPGAKYTRRMWAMPLQEGNWKPKCDCWVQCVTFCFCFFFRLNKFKECNVSSQATAWFKK